MATQFLNVTFDGATDVPRLTGQSAVKWETSGSRPTIDRYSVFVETPDDLDATLNLTGSDWRIRMLQVAGDDHITRIKDLNNGTGREIEYLNLGYNSDVDLTSTKVRYMNGWDGDEHDIKLGPQNDWMHWLNLGADMNKVETSVGYIGGVDIYRGRADITVHGEVGSIDLGNLKDRMVVDGGRVGVVLLQDGNDTVLVKNGGRIDSLKAWGGTNTIDVKAGSRIDHIRGGEGTLNIQATGNGRLESVNAYEGKLNLSTADRYVNTIQGWQVETDIVIGKGGAGTIKFTSETTQTHKITGSTEGYIALIETTDSTANIADDQSAIIDVGYFVGAIRTGNGVDSVTTGDGLTGFVESIYTAGGDDTVTVGTGGAGLVSTSRGDDVVKISDLSYILEEEATVVRGGSGTDELSFAAFSKGVTFSLANAGAAQEVAKDSGFFSELGVENLSGSNFADILTGDAGANELSGRGGADKIFGGDQKDVLKGAAGDDRLFGQKGTDNLFGGQGNDLLNGGKGNDSLTGDGGSDIFIFGKDSGKDRVEDFVDGKDTLRLVDHAGGFGDLTFSNAGSNLKVTHDNGTSGLVGEAGTVLTSADFDFV